jgi:hypothetical protein
MEGSSVLKNIRTGSDVISRFLFRTFVTSFCAAVFSRGGAKLLVDDHEREQQRRRGVQLRGHEPGRHGREECLAHLLPPQQLAR